MMPVDSKPDNKRGQISEINLNCFVQKQEIYEFEKCLTHLLNQFTLKKGAIDTLIFFSKWCSIQFQFHTDERLLQQSVGVSS